jgi:hypothetical protein
MPDWIGIDYGWYVASYNLLLEILAMKEMEWIDWEKFPVPESVFGILIKYEDGIFSDRYDHKTGKRKYRPSKILGWRFMERSDPNKKSVQCQIICMD